MKQQEHSPSPHGQLRQPVLIVWTGLETDEVVLLLEEVEPGMIMAVAELVAKEWCRTVVEDSRAGG